MSRIVYFLNGPNLNLLGKREPHIYGHQTLTDVEADCQRLAEELLVQLECHQSNAEHELIDWIQQARERAGGIVINPASLSHTSIGIADALAACAMPIVEVHISNIHKREEFRHHSFISAAARAVMVGFGVQGYPLAIAALVRLQPKM